MTSAGARLWRGFFGGWLNATVTIVTLAVVWLVVAPIVRWALLDAVWVGDAKTCAAAEGACWAFIGEKLRFILFAFYPFGEHWRAALALAALVAVLGLSAVPRLWSVWLAGACAGLLASAWALLGGGLFGPPVPMAQWGGLPLTLLITILAFAGGFPIGLALALGRRSRLPILSWLCTIYIELARGIPLITALYLAMLVLPLALPEGVELETLVRASLAMTLFFAAYFAEIIRAGLQGVPESQTEAALSLGYSPFGAMRHVILPQALRSVVPALVTIAIGILQSTTLVAAIGVFDLLNAARQAANDTAWLGFYDEAYAFAALVYFTLCFGASRYSVWLEKRL
ncbi:amino acid ABC transporter permease [Methylopila sp. M107]|uniref:amino acid ABC transporter permease n=1 Tax=Methylopila sp. M107 TaxID=1101190 RepID=UPI000369CF42|nr:amino acid ABC transporter permease [Methylopila sp. M107]